MQPMRISFSLSSSSGQRLPPDRNVSYQCRRDKLSNLLPLSQRHCAACLPMPLPEFLGPAARVLLDGLFAVQLTASLVLHRANI